jgi:hypothetical protein
MCYHTKVIDWDRGLTNFLPSWSPTTIFLSSLDYRCGTQRSALNIIFLKHYSLGSAARRFQYWSVKAIDIRPPEDERHCSHPPWGGEKTSQGRRIEPSLDKRTMGFVEASGRQIWTAILMCWAEWGRRAGRYKDAGRCLWCHGNPGGCHREDGCFRKGYKRNTLPTVKFYPSVLLAPQIPVLCGSWVAECLSDCAFSPGTQGHRWMEILSSLNTYSVLGTVHTVLV